MEKMTRKSYKRRRIILGVGLFASASLIATGFAAWVISANATGAKEGNVKVGAVNDNQVTITSIALTKDSFVFEPKDTDTTGRVRYDGTNSENLGITITATVSPATYVKDINVKLVVPDGVKTAAGSTKNYIVLPDCAADAGVTINKGSTGLIVNTMDDTKLDFTYTISFQWGSAFGGVNPGEYYDTGAGSSTTIDDVKTALNDFYTTMGNLASQAFTINLTADIN
jgi:hypothetical protein